MLWWREQVPSPGPRTLLQDVGKQVNILADATGPGMELWQPKPRKPSTQVGGREVHVTASLGISIYTEQCQDAESLVHRADIAMYQAKKNGGCNYRFFAAESSSTFQARTILGDNGSEIFSQHGIPLTSLSP